MTAALKPSSLAVSLCAFLLLPHAAAAQFVPNDIIVSDPDVDVRDPEFDDNGNQMVWQDVAGNLWLADIDPATGALIPTNGRGTLLDVGLADIGPVGNGPEWVYDSNGKAAIGYTKDVGGVLTLALAEEDEFGVWTAGVLPNGSDRYRPEGTRAFTDSPPRMIYNRIDGEDIVVSWRDAADETTEQTINAAGQGGRWLPSGQRFLATLNVSGITQVIEVDQDTGDVEQITFEPTPVFNPAIWFSPEYNAPGFSAMVGLKSVGIFIEMDGTWVNTYTFNLPSTFEFVSSPEVFVHNGRSYVVVVAAEELGIGPFPFQPADNSEIWIAGIDPDNPFFRRIDEGTPNVRRTEPEFFHTDTTVKVYYTEDPGTKALVRLADTGLGLDNDYDIEALGGPWAVQHRDNRNSASVPFPLPALYTVAGTVLESTAQTMRPTLGPEGNLTFPFITPVSGERQLCSIDGDTLVERYRLSDKQVGSSTAGLNGLVGADGDIYTASGEYVTRISPEGQIIWRLVNPGFARSPQFLPDGNLIIYTWNGWERIVSRDGALLWDHRLTGNRTYPSEPICLSTGQPSDCAFVGVPAVDPVNNVVYSSYTTPAGDTRIVSRTYDPDTNTMAFTSRLRFPWLQGLATAPVLSADYATIYVQDGAGNLVAIDTATGARRWTFSLGFFSKRPPVVSDNGYIMPGGMNSEVPAYNFVGIVQDLGTSAVWAYQDFLFTPQSSSAVDGSDRFVIGVVNASTLEPFLMSVSPSGIDGLTPFGQGSPSAMNGLAVRSDGRVFLHASGGIALKAFDPATPAP
ncbi:MAG: PQQ-binding-like beta-propeller repeat protein [Pseudomonadota bacterium]